MSILPFKEFRKEEKHQKPPAGEFLILPARGVHFDRTEVLAARAGETSPSGSDRQVTDALIKS